jgi:hypothetical protein
MFLNKVKLKNCVLLGVTMKCAFESFKSFNLEGFVVDSMTTITFNLVTPTKFHQALCISFSQLGWMHFNEVLK